MAQERRTPGRLMSDLELVRAVIARDPEAAGLFVARFGRFLEATARRCTGLDADSARCVVQIVIEKLWEDGFRRLRNWSGEGDLASYLARIVRNCAHDEARRQMRRQRVGRQPLIAMQDPDLIPADVAGGDPRTESELRERKEIVRSAMDRLSDRDRDLLERRYLGEQSVAEIAMALQMSDNAVYQALHRAIGRLRELLRRDGPELFDDGPEPGGEREERAG